LSLDEGKVLIIVAKQWKEKLWTQSY
jgi:hypothetical protein